MTDARDDYREKRSELERLWESQDEGVSRMSVVDLLAGTGRGPIWGEATDDLNMTLLAWPAGQGPAEHVNDERDVVVVVVDGSGVVTLDGVSDELRAGHAVVCRRGQRRSFSAGPGGMRYLSIHLRRGGLEIGRLPADG